MSIKSLRLLDFALILCRARSLCQNRIAFTVLALMGNVYLADFTRTSAGHGERFCPLEIKSSQIGELDNHSNRGR